MVPQVAEVEARAPFTTPAIQRRWGFIRVRLSSTAGRSPTPHPHPGRDYPTARSSPRRNAHEYAIRTPIPVPEIQVRLSSGVIASTFEYNNFSCIALQVSSDQLSESGLLDIAQDAVQRGRTTERVVRGPESETSTTIGVFEGDFGTPLRRVWRNPSPCRRWPMWKQWVKRIAANLSYR